MSFEVFWNNTARTAEPARVSAMPINRVWPGKQRSLDQTEIAWFVNLDWVEGVREAKLLIKIDDALRQTIEIRPLASAIPTYVDVDGIHLTLTKPCHFTVEVNGRAGTLHVFVNPPEDPFVPGEGDWYFGPGIHDAGVIMPQSGQTVYLAAGAVVYGAIFIYRAKDVRIMGRGILDASKFRRGNDSDPANGELLEPAIAKLGLSAKDAHYSGAVVAYECTDLTISGITVRDSMFWTLIVRNHCRNVVIDNIKIIGQWRYNSDGINICASQDVIVRNSFVRSFDDCIVGRGAVLAGESGPLDRLLVENCILWCDWGKSLEVWAGNVPCRIANVTFQNIHLIHLSVVALDITTWFGSSDTVIENIKFQNIVIDPDEQYQSPEMQTIDHQKYVSKVGWLPMLAVVDCQRLGVNLGNQQVQLATNLAPFHLSYQKIVFQNIRFSQSGFPALPVTVSGVPDCLCIDDVQIDNVSASCITVTGNVKNLVQR